MSDATITTGRYRYLLNGAEIPVDEPFSIEQQTRGTEVVSSRSAPGTRLAVQAIYGIDGSAECVLQWSSELEGTASTVHATYEVAPDGTIDATWSTAGGPAQSARVDSGATAPSFFPLMRVFSGRSVAKLVAVAPAQLPVVVPDIRDPKHVAAFLTPLMGDRFVASAEPGTCEVDGVVRQCTVVDYRGGSYDSDATVYLDDGGLLLRYTWPQEGVGEWDVQLSDVVGAWPMPTSW